MCTRSNDRNDPASRPAIHLPGEEERKSRGKEKERIGYKGKKREKKGGKE